jgi:hypothetical protein
MSLGTDLRQKGLQTFSVVDGDEGWLGVRDDFRNWSVRAA